MTTLAVLAPFCSLRRRPRPSTMILEQSVLLQTRDSSGVLQIEPIGKHERRVYAMLYVQMPRRCGRGFLGPQRF